MYCLHKILDDGGEGGSDASCCNFEVVAGRQSVCEVDRFCVDTELPIDRHR